MPLPTTWMVRSGGGGKYFDDFRDRSMVAIGWAKVGDLASLSREQVMEIVRQAYPEFRSQAVAKAAGQLFRFASEFAEGDRVVTYDPRARKYLCGQIVGGYHFWPDEENEEFLNQRKVKWGHEFPRDDLTDAAQNSLGAISTIFKVPTSVSAELWRESTANVAVQSLPKVDDDEELAVGITTESTDEEISSLASEAIKDRIARLNWQEMQELVAGLLRAMGYKTTVSPSGPDRGKDIIASPDGFGFQEPRIVVEVKHRREQRMGSQEIRSFLGGRHPSDKGLYVSTGGFSKDAYYEAERANIPLTLMDFELLVDAILSHYAAFDEETKQLLPLKRIYWPVVK